MSVLNHAPRTTHNNTTKVAEAAFHMRGSWNAVPMAIGTRLWWFIMRKLPESLPS